MPRTLQIFMLRGICKAESQYFACGGQADIYRGQWIQEPTGETILVAIKVLRRCTGNDTAEAKHARKRLLREPRLWSQLHHPHIVPFYGLVPEQDYPGLVMPYYKNGDLSQFLKQHPQVNKLDLICGAVAGLEYMHNLKPHAIIHGDIKAHNILVTDNKQACLADFGSSRTLSSTSLPSSPIEGACPWMAPELHRHENPRPTTSSDVWALGMTILEVFTGRIPFDHIPSSSLVILGVGLGNLPPRPPEIDEVMWALLNRCWSLDPSRRPHVETVSIVLNIMTHQNLSLDIIHHLMDYIETPQLCLKHLTPRKRPVVDFLRALLWQNHTLARGLSFLHKAFLCFRDALSLNVFFRQPDAPVTSGKVHKESTTCGFPCYWPECGGRFDTLMARRGHLISHWHQWMNGHQYTETNT